MKNIQINFLLTILVLGASLGACATMSPEQCQSANWFELGRSDGSRGREADLVDSYASQCGKHGHSVNYKDYRAGRNEGLKEFCTFDGGYHHGSSGYTNSHVCPSELAAEFNKGHRIGYREYDLRRQQEELEDRIEDLEKKEKDYQRSQTFKRLGTPPRQTHTYRFAF
jgi:hypothetical protein